jgi:hypothetical protein
MLRQPTELRTGWTKRSTSAEANPCVGGLSLQIVGNRLHFGGDLGGP